MRICCRRSTLETGGERRDAGEDRAAAVIAGARARESLAMAKYCITNVDEAIRIRNEERGETALLGLRQGPEWDG